MSKKKGCDGPCDCVPVESGWYWATSRKYPHWGRVIVLVGKNGHGHTRIFTARYAGSYGLEDFTDYAGPLTEPKK